MKLVSLKASSVRGIPKDWPDLVIGDKGLIVYGPNGVGKSSVIDALEFVLTQQSTLFSENRQGVSWETASPHVRYGMPNITVSLNDRGTVRDIKSGAPLPTDLTPEGRNWLETAKKSRFVLRRHMLLRFIVEQPAGRYGQLEPFFNMGAFSPIENALQGLAATNNTSKAREEAEIQALDAQLRARFSAQATAVLSDATFYSLLNSTLDKLGLARCADSAALTERRAQVAQQLGGKDKTERIGALHGLKNQAQQLGVTSALRPLLDNFLSAIATQEREVAHRTQEVLTEFLMRSREIVAAANLDECPLCEEVIKDRAALLQRLDERIAADERITAAKEQAMSALRPLAGGVADLENAMVRFSRDWKTSVGSALPVAYDDASALLSQLKAILEEKNPTYSQLAHYPPLLDAARIDHSAVLKMIDDWMSAEGAGERHGLLGNAAGMIDALLKEWQLHKQHTETGKKLSQRFRILDRLHSYAVEARKDAVQAVVNEVSDTANTFYERIHPNETLATSKLAVRQAAAASVEIRADFHGVETHPLRYFSESHLDTLGLCYFLALCKRQTTQTPHFRLLILDDVMHSVDASHRVRVAEVLATYFGDFQIIITTHDEPFYSRLRQLLGGGGYSYKVFSDWNITSGPTLGDPSTNLDMITNEAIRKTMNRDSLAAAGGVFFEWLLKEVTESLDISLMARFKRKHTLDTLWKPACAKLKGHKGFESTHPQLAANLDANAWVRNECGAHHNETASAASLPEVQEFASLLADLYNAVWCGGCRNFIAKQKDEGWRCVCAKLNYPKNPPNDSAGTSGPPHTVAIR